MPEQYAQQLRNGLTLAACDRHGDDWRAFSVMFSGGIRDYTVMCRQDAADLHTLTTRDADEAADYMRRMATGWMPAE